MIGNMPRSASPVIGDCSDVTWCLVGRGTDTDKQPSERCVGPSSRLHTCDTETHNKERNSVGGVGGTTFDVSSGVHRCGVSVSNTRMRSHPKRNPFFSWYSTLTPHFWTPFDSVPPYALLRMNKYTILFLFIFSKSYILYFEFPHF